MPNDPIVIVSAVRTPMGGFQGSLSALSASDLGAVAIKAAVERAGLCPESVDEVMMGCVLPGGLGQSPARQAAIKAGLPLSTACSLINKACGSGMKTAMFAHDLLVAGSIDIAVAGGMESMSNAPYLLSKARGGYRLGHGQLMDHMFLDGLEDSYFDKGRLMGTFAEECAGEYGFTRDEQDAYAVTSTTRAQDAIKSGAFAWETAPVTVSGRGGDAVVSDDEQPPKAQLDKIPTLKPAFAKNGTVTPANSSSISDGAAALTLMRASTAERLGLNPLARVIGHANYAAEPRKFCTAPIGSIRKLFDKTGWSVGGVDLWEINEAFAVVSMVTIRQLELDRDRVNVHGGACALGHPVGASGARLLATLLGALRKTGGKRGVASLCIGGGEATAMALELV